MDNRNKIIKMVGILFGLAIVVWLLTMMHHQSQKTLSDYALENPELQNQVSTDEVNSKEAEMVADSDAKPSDAGESGTETSSGSKSSSDSQDSSDSEALTDTDATTSETESSDVPVLPGLSHNGTSVSQFRKSLNDDFYYEPLSDSLRDYITGVSYPTEESLKAIGKSKIEIAYDDLCYMHLLHYDFNGEVVEGELICNLKIADDLMDIFSELYENEYQIEKIRLIDEYDGDDHASMTDNNTSCFNYRTVDNSSSLSKHAMGLAIDVNPQYNPYITYNKDGSENCSPENGIDYADRSKSFPYKIDENDLCYKLFKKHGFTWGGNWNSVKDYQHFQKAK